MRGPGRAIAFKNSGLKPAKKTAGQSRRFPSEPWLVKTAVRCTGLSPRERTYCVSQVMIRGDCGTVFPHFIRSAFPSAYSTRKRLLTEAKAGGLSSRSVNSWARAMLWASATKRMW